MWAWVLLMHELDTIFDCGAVAMWAQVLLPALESLTSLASLYLSLNNIDAKNKSKMAGALRYRLRTFHI